MESKLRFEVGVGSARFSKLQCVGDFQNIWLQIEHFLWLKSVFFEIPKKLKHGAEFLLRPKQARFRQARQKHTTRASSMITSKLCQ